MGAAGAMILRTPETSYLAGDYFQALRNILVLQKSQALNKQNIKTLWSFFLARC